MDIHNAKKKLVIEPPRQMYKWARIFNRLQCNFFEEQPIKLRREKQIEDFIRLNGYQRVKFVTDTDLFDSMTDIERADDADLIVITDQRFSRYPCPVIIERIQDRLEEFSALYLCLNRCYINVDNSYHDPSLSAHYPRAITQWLQRSLPDHDIIDLSLDYDERGLSFTWAVPDRHYFIRNK